MRFLSERMITLVEELHGDMQLGDLMYVPVYRKSVPYATAVMRLLEEHGGKRTGQGSTFTGRLPFPSAGKNLTPLRLRAGG